MDRLYAVVTSELDSLVEMPLTVVHGDLFPEDVLVDEDARPLALIDFGFMSTAVEPRFDAAVSGAIYNMYGDHARRLRWTLTNMLAAELSYEMHVLVLFQVVYAFATSNAFTVDGSDGHSPGELSC
jgi:serine/threonine protein kinase